MPSSSWILLFEPRLRPLWRVVLVLLLVSVTVLALGEAPMAAATLPHADKINHLVAFAALALTASAAVQPRWRNGFLIAVGLLAYGGLIEIAQTQLPHRQGDWADLLADAAGIAIGLMAVALLRRPRLPAGRAGDGGRPGRSG